MNKRLHQTTLEVCVQGHFVKILECKRLPYPAALEKSSINLLSAMKGNQSALTNWTECPKEGTWTGRGTLRRSDRKQH